MPLIAVGLSACAASETPQATATRLAQETATERPAIEAKDAAYVAAFNAANFAATSGTYAEDGVQMPPNMPANKGRAAIRAADSTFMSFGKSVLSVTTVDVQVNGPLAISRGEWTFEFTPNKNAPPGMKAVTDHGKSLTHWQKVNGEWMMKWDIWNPDTQAPTPAAQAAKPAAKE
jgi:ketosteroid isomerase-like protein